MGMRCSSSKDRKLSPNLQTVKHLKTTTKLQLDFAVKLRFYTSLWDTQPITRHKPDGFQEP